MFGLKDSQTNATRGSIRRVGAAMVATLIGLLSVTLLTASPASAHTGTDSYLYLDVTPTALSGRVELPIGYAEETLQIELGESDAERTASIEANADALESYVAERLSIGQEGQDWAITYEDPFLFFSEDVEISADYIVVPFTAETGGETVNQELDIRFEPFFDEVDDAAALVLIANNWAAGKIENGTEHSAVFDSGNRSQLVDLGDKSVLKNVTESAKLGVRHIQTGPDHILFVLVLLLPSVLVFSSSWRPAPSFGSALWRVLKIVTMFTVAHSITFTLAGLDILPQPSPRIVESIIALSIAAAALHNLRPIVENREWLISFAFGLFHGMGFASLVSALDVSRSTQLISLLGRNLGIEVGQAIVVLLLFPGLFILRRTRFYKPFFVVVSLILTVVSLGWMVERLFELDLGVDIFVDPVFEWPRVLIFIGLFTAVAAGLYFLEKGKDELLPVDDQTLSTGLKDPELVGAE